MTNAPPSQSATLEVARAPGWGLEQLLELASNEDRQSLAARVRVKLDPNKRIGEVAQLARGLLLLPWAHDPAILPEAERDLLRELLSAQGQQRVTRVPQAARALQQRGALWILPQEDGGTLLVVPLGFVVQMATWEGEEPRSLRALLVQTSDEAQRNVAGFYLGKPAIRPWALPLEAAFRHLTHETRIAETLKELPAPERAVLAAIERLGGEVETEELLELEREPLRLRTASGATQIRRGLSYALERRGLLLPLPPNRHVIPHEVARVVGARRTAEREERRQLVRQWASLDHAPVRAVPGVDPTASALAMALEVRGQGHTARSPAGTPRSWLKRLSTTLGIEAPTVALLAALSRSLGLWEPTAVGAKAEQLDFKVGELSVRLFERWRRGGVWDEVREEPEIQRVNDSTAVQFAGAAPAAGHVLRDLVLEALLALSDRSWAPWSSIVEYVCHDHRAAGMARALQRWSTRTGAVVLDLEVATRRMVLLSLRALGVVDVGTEPFAAALPGVPMVGSELGEFGAPVQAIRLTARGRAITSGQAVTGTESTHFVDAWTLRVGADARVSDVLCLAPWVEVTRTQPSLEVVFREARLAQDLAQRGSAEDVLAAIGALVAVPAELVERVEKAAAGQAHGVLQDASGFLWVEDAELRARLLEHPDTAGLFVPHSPTGGLLVAAGITRAQLSARCRALGVKVDRAQVRAHADGARRKPRSRTL